ncbi:hypothetical protein TNCV_1242201 [Trichonephila clavipes]|nr:hypothetical protein TNCV_1242201 [Trichonephila clavipes]
MSLFKNRDQGQDTHLSVLRVVIDVEKSWHLYYIPCATLPIVGEVDPIVVVVKFERDLVAVKCPRTELHHALLLIEGEVRDVDAARALVDGRWDPHHPSIGINEDVRLVTYLIVAISAATRKDFVKFHMRSLSMYTERIASSNIGYTALQIDTE